MRRFLPIRPASILLLALSTAPVHGQRQQQARIDSLLSILPRLHGDSARVKALCDLSFTYFVVDPASGIRYGERAAALAEKLNWPKAKAWAYNSLGANYWAKNDFLQAEEYYLRSLRISQLSGNRQDMARGYHNIGDGYASRLDYLKALEYYKKALDLYLEVKDTESAMGCFSNIASVYDAQNDLPMAQEYYSRALQKAEETANPRNVAYMSGLLGLVDAKQGQYDKALEFEQRSLRTLEKLGDKDDAATRLTDVGDVYLLRKEYSRARTCFQKAFEEESILNGKFSREYAGQDLAKIGETWLLTAGEGDEGSLRQAETNLRNSVLLSRSVNDWAGLEHALPLLAESQARQGHYAAALATQKEYDCYKDSIYDSKKGKEMARQELEYEYDRKKDSLNYLSNLQTAQLKALQQQEELDKLTGKQHWLYNIIIIIGLGLIGSYLFYRNRLQHLRLRNQLIREKSEKQLKETEYQRRLNDITFAALRSQMNPHFIFNALNTIQSYVYSNDKRSASNYLGKFSELIRKILDSSNRQTITLEEEIELLGLYMDIEKARFGDRFFADIRTEPGLPVEDIFIPPMLIQPYVENAIKHGLLHRSGDKKLLVSISRSKDLQDIEIVIDDNGVGRAMSMEINQKRIGHTSFANSANEQRLDLINQLLDRKTKLEIIDKKNADNSSAGTTVIISIPLVVSQIL